MTNGTTLYDVLNISQDSSVEEIKRAYRKLSLKYHPDKNVGSESSHKFHEISDAYEVLSDPQKKKKYDTELHFMKHGNPMGVFAETYDLNEIFSHLFSKSDGVFPTPPMNMNTNINMNNEWKPNHFYNQLSKPPPIIKTIQVDIEKICEQQSIPLEIERWVIEGNEKMKEKEKIYVDVAAGIDDNELIVLRNKGNINQQGVAGDIKIFINITNNSIFTRKGINLEMSKQITLREALCGFSFELLHINGKRYTINNERGNVIESNYKKTIPNLGIKRGDKIGSLIIHFVVTFPATLPLDVIEKLDKLLLL